MHSYVKRKKFAAITMLMIFLVTMCVRYTLAQSSNAYLGKVWLNDSYEDCFPALVREGKRWFYVSQDGKELPLYAELRL